jgi:hypothetical protein
MGARSFAGLERTIVAVAPVGGGRFDAHRAHFWITATAGRDGAGEEKW